MCGSRRIAVLPPNLANQIAAGEVVERPASVVKELVENALDAAAREVRIETEEGGRRLIRVSDDGEGMGPEDARAAFERHATSKIHTPEDLRAVSSYGFRGEALPSIASVARVRLVTKRRSDAAASEIRLAGGRFERQAEAGAPDGTLVEVADLFFNTPARMKFLRRAAVESARVADVLTRLALGRPDAGFTLLQGGRAALETRAGVPLTERIVDVLGGALGGGLVPVDFRAGVAAIRGFVSPPDRTQPTARALYLFVNDRPIRDRSLQHALLSAARDFIPQNRFPVAVIQMQIPPELVDENVHPAKLEVRFREPRAVY
ncbi:MAG: DNA mismatch repair endonuclease MutL, partial [Myxococcota bacterium]